MLSPDILDGIYNSDGLKTISDQHGVSTDSLVTAFKAISPKLMDGSADIGGFGLALLSGVFKNVPAEETEEKGQQLLEILFKDTQARAALISDASKASGLSADKINEMLPSLACFIASYATKAMSTESSEIMDALTGGAGKKLL